MPVRPIFGRVIVFHVINRRRFSSGLYSGNTDRDNLFGPQWVYVYGASSECDYKFLPGQKVLLQDGMALLDVDLKLYDSVLEDQRFAELHKEVQDYEADVVTKAVLEGAIIAADTEEEIPLKLAIDESQETLAHQ